MNKLRSFFALSISIIALLVVGVSAQGKAAPINSVEKQIFKELISLPRYGVFDHIAFQVKGSTLTLTGKVYSLGTKNQAARFVRDVPGITTVINNIEELPPSSFDDRIRRETLRSFSNYGLSRYFWETRPDVRIIVEHGNITLEGFVMNTGDYNLLNILANGISGVFSVKNNLVLGKEIYR